MTRQEIINKVHCSVCNAPAGKPCVEKKGHGGYRPRKRVHPARSNAATGGKFNGWKRPRTKVKVEPNPAMQIDAKSFYASWEWKEARFVALKRHGRRCQCCGWSPSDSATGRLVVDHIKPIRTHPHLALDPENHQVLCEDCNMGTSYKHTDDFRSLQS